VVVEVVELGDVVDVEVVEVVEIWAAVRTQIFFLETNRQITGTFTFFTWTVDLVPSF